MKNISYTSFIRQKSPFPIWFMRQAGRYQNKYKILKKSYTFDDLCYNHNLSALVAYNAYIDTDLDYAILFSDILFSLRYLGADISFTPGPVIKPCYRSEKDITFYEDSDIDFTFQGKSIRILNLFMGNSSNIIGFIGGIFTLYHFFINGGTSKKKVSEEAYHGISDGRYSAFVEAIIPILYKQISTQISAGANCFAIFDTCAGYIDNIDFFSKHAIGVLVPLIDRLRSSFPSVPILYYTYTHSLDQAICIDRSDICDIIGVSHNIDLCSVISSCHKHIYGNCSPHIFSYDDHYYYTMCEKFFSSVKSIPIQDIYRLSIGLGHGIPPSTKSQYIMDFVKKIRDFRDNIY